MNAPVVVALGRVALDALASIERRGLDLRRDVGVARPWRDRALIALYHPGRQALLHRPDALQRDDWGRVGALVRAEPAARFVPANTPSYHEAG